MKWQMHIAGPDDIEVYDDELTALRDANKINIRYVRDREANPGAEVLCVATVWPLVDCDDKENSHADTD